MSRLTSVQQRLRRMGLITIAGIVSVVLLTGCDSLGTNDSGILARDMYDVKTKLDKYLDQQTVSDRQLKYTLNSIDENLQGRNDITKTALDDLEKRMRDQTEEIRTLHSQVEASNFALDALSKRLGMAGGVTPPPSSGATSAAAAGSSPAPSRPATATGAGANTTAAQPAASSIDQLMAGGQRQFNLQNYAGARDEFTRALSQNPQGDNRVEILYWLAESYFKMNDLDNAKKNYTQVIEANAKHAKAWISVEQLANISLAQGEKDYALVLLKLIVDKYPNYPDISRVKAAIAKIQQGAAAAPAASPAPGAGQ